MIVNLRIGIRLSLIVVILLAALAGVSFYALHEIRDRLLAERQSQTRIMVQGALTQIVRFHAMELDGVISREVAQKMALRAADTLRYGPDQYVWVNDSRPVVLSHPIEAMVGRNVGDLRDADGRPLFREFIRISTASGHGTVTYKWPRVNDDVPRLKISYVEGFAPWDWTVGSGVYVDDIDAAYDAAARRFGLFALLAGLASALVVWLVGSTITRPLSQITRHMTRLASGQDVGVPETSRADEVGELMRAMAAFKRHLAEKEQFREAHDCVLREAGTVFNLIGDAVMVTDARNHIKLVNPAFTRITGYGPDEVIGRSPSILASGRHDDAFYTAMWEHLAKTGTWNGEIWNRSKSGETYPEWLSITAIKDRGGQAQGYVATFSNISERKRRETRMRWQAEHDALTGLANRSCFETSLAVAVAEVRDRQDGLALLYIDLDGFKAVNDTMGHAAGDAVLIVVAKRLHEVVRADDVVARLGGDEFAVVIPALHRQADALAIAEKIVSRLSEPFVIGRNVAHIGASVGIALYPDHGASPDELTTAADAAMYRRKQAGRNGVAMAEAAAARPVAATVP
ncbi:methyl-accepting chemotaxis protein [Paramagnetospirillum caucaseum]|uniref:Methyl-accepting chemotaxis protein n=1 Tax=Paramagnetospirillum caucaseum TaxID=1244869 RepID=M2Z746_9PROT|nr:diguanylate cyclase [Paramagnetospirillum caucaseum]EME70125.1 methyl-accepting chemotaxis protein [Paramagnetospirillum caucaseum]